MKLGLVWRAGFCEHCDETSGFVRCGGTSRPAEEMFCVPISPHLSSSSRLASEVSPQLNPDGFESSARPVPV